MSSTIGRRARRLVTAVAGAVVASLALTGCLYAMIPETRPAPTTSAPPVADGVSAELMEFYTQELTWEACAGEGFDCTTVRAPLDWDEPTTGDIELSVIRHRASGGEPLGSLLTNPGGPGASGVGFIRDSVAFAAGAEVMETYDVIGFDPRGVGESTAVSCYDATQMDAYLFDIPAAAPATPEWTAEVTEATRAFGAACEANSDGILPYITTVQAARDLDLLRAVLGDAKLNYLGYSYGTFLGATYAELYPERVGRLVLDGAVDPEMSLLEVSMIQTIGFESALRAYMADCLSTSDCPFRGTVDDGMADVSALLASVEARPLQAADGRAMGVSSLWTAIVFTLYAEANWPYLTTAFTETLAGDPEFAFVLADAYYSRANGAYLDNSAEAFRAYNCMDYPRDVTAEQVADAEALLRERAPTAAPYWVSPELSCSTWPHPATGVREPLHAEGAPPILVIGTTNDPATPYEWSVALADQLESGILVTRVGEGHTGFNKGNACVDAVVVDYLVEGVVPAGDVRCE